MSDPDDDEIVKHVMVWMGVVIATLAGMIGVVILLRFLSSLF